MAQNGWGVVRFSQSARKHRIGRAHALHVIANNQPITIEEPDKPARLVWLAADDRGIRLEITAINTPVYLLVIHVMPNDLRRRKQ
ncbi:MAG: hypothetical protein WCP28_14830 [Actinomycetes bacterium]